MELIFIQRIPVTHDLPELMFNTKFLEHLGQQCISCVFLSIYRIMIVIHLFIYFILFFSSHDLHMALPPQDTEHVNLTENYIKLNIQGTIS
jgi:hypothetical protein